MKYDFDTPQNRFNTNSLKWDVDKNELPMWVADMDFQTAPEITEAIIKRAQSGIFGYTVVPENWYGAIIGWWKKNHNFEINKDWLCFCTGVVPAVSSIVKRITNVGDNIVLQTPVYDIFFHSVENAGRHVLENKLVYEHGGYRIDFADLEDKLKNPLTTMLILCNPHNPIGKPWSSDELSRIGGLCKKYGITVLSDEIHCDLTDVGVKYTPFASVSSDCLNNSITCVSASKAFNIAGLQSAAVFVADESLRNKVVRGLNSDEVAEPNCFAAEATAIAFERGGEWLNALRAYLEINKKTATEFIEKNIPGLSVVRQTATYLLWIDCGNITDNAESLSAHIRKATGLYLSAGNQYRGNGNRFLRMNVACPMSRLTDGLERLKMGVATFKNK